jgi:CHAD domain-containing protein
VRLAAGDGFELPDLGGEAAEPRVFRTVYYDTADLRLARAGVSLRRRTEHGKQLWQLRLAGASRARLEAPGGPAAPPAKLARLLSALTRGGPLEQVAVLRTRRELVRMDGGSDADVAFDSVAVMEGRRVTRTFEDVEIRAGRTRDLRRLERKLRAAGARDEEPRTKLARAVELDDGEIAAPTRVQAMMRAQLEQILEHDPGARLGDDPEDVHQLRVATRRLRAVLRAARPVIAGAWGEELREELRWLGGALGPVRDLDVLIDELAADASSLEEGDHQALAPVFAALAEERDAARRALLEALESERYVSLLERIEETAAAPGLVAETTALRDLWRAELRRLRKRMRRLPDEPADKELHAARIAVKRARYAAELAEPELGATGRRFVARAKALQDVLGEHQDAVVAEERVRALADSLAAGRLVERQRARRRQARERFPKAWRKLDRAA